MVAQGFTVDLNKPLVFQVGHLGESYEEWVHQPIVTKEGPRFFHSDFWEFLTLTRWWVIPVIWLPVAIWCISKSVSMGLSLTEIVPLIALGIFIWTFIEYTLHRFLFHIKTKSYWGNTAHYLLHGCHHKHPMDHLRLVFPPAATAVLCFPFWNLVKLFATPSTTPALFGGGMLGYVMYDVTHYYLHHAQPTRAVTKNLKKYHLNHHFRIQDKGFGITSSLWDIVTQGNKAGSTQVAWNTMCLSTAKGHAASALFLEDIVATDVMKLLELEKPEDESHYNMARESLLSPDLPQVDFLDSLIVNEDKNPATALDLVARDNVDLSDTINSSEAFSTQSASISIIRIFHAANNCIQRCPSITRAEWAVPAILFSLKMEENLLARDRVCVFLSLLLHNFSVVSSMNIGNILDDNACSCLDSFSKHIDGVMADTEARCIISEFLEELLSLLQDLLSEQRVLFCVESSETSESDLSIPVTLNGVSVALFRRMALIDHLVAGSAIMAAICTAVDRVGFIREASFEILHKNSHEKSSVPLTILHVFAHIAGEKMMSSSDHDVSVAVLKSIVMFLEKRHFGTVEGNAYMHPGKNKCLFSNKSSSLEAMASMLMEIIQEFTKSNTLHQSFTEKSEFRAAHKDFQCVLGRDQSVTLCDILSLVKLIACYTEWDWTSANIVAPLLKILGMPLAMNLSVAIVSLLGELSSIGVDAGGYENEGISNLREKLSAFLQCETTLKAGFAVQIATVSSLMKTLHLDFSVVVQGKTTMLPGCGDHSLSASANLVTKWFSLLSDEQRVFSNKFLQTSVVR
ncbi:unnamed protein product [Brassica oleracea]